MKASSLLGAGETSSIAPDRRFRCDLSTVDVETLCREIGLRVEPTDRTMAGSERQIMESMHSITTDLNIIPSLDTSCLEKLEKDLSSEGTHVFNKRLESINDPLHQASTHIVNPRDQNTDYYDSTLDDLSSISDSESKCLLTSIDVSSKSSAKSGASTLTRTGITNFKCKLSGHKACYNTSKASSTSHPSFLVSLRAILDENLGSSVTAWHLDGSKFDVTDAKELTPILQRYFGEKATFATFRRQLNRYKFHVKCVNNKEYPPKYTCSNENFTVVHLRVVIFLVS